METSSLTKSLLNFANSPQDLNEDERKAFLAACEKAKRAVESPLEATTRMMYGVYEGMALRLGVDMKLIDHAVAVKKTLTAEELAKATGADVLLVVRVMRMLVGIGIFKEVGRNQYAANKLAEAYVPGSPLRAFVVFCAAVSPSVAMLPNYFETKGYTNPTDTHDGPFNFTFQTRESFFDWMGRRPHIQEAFNTTMRISRVDRGKQWFEFYPVEERLKLLNPQKSDILMVDVGGNVGLDLIAFHEKFPHLPGQLIFTDLPKVIESAGELPNGYHGIKWNFFSPPPERIHDAKVYYLRTVLHDWPDKQARQILESVKMAMSKDSVLLINEHIMSDENVALFQAELDFVMLSLFASLNRTIGQFEKLLNEVGFKLINVWKPSEVGPGGSMLLEAVLSE